MNPAATEADEIMRSLYDFLSGDDGPKGNTPFHSEQAG